MIKKYQAGLIICIVIILSLVIGLNHNHSKVKMKEIVTRPSWIIGMTIIIIFILYILFTAKHLGKFEKNRVLESLKKAIIAIIIAFCAESSLTISPFWIVFVISYFMEGWRLI
jgi:hypothetical protein